MKYDSAGRLIQVGYDDGSAITYTFDPGGNLLARAYHTPLETFCLEDDAVIVGQNIVNQILVCQTSSSIIVDSTSINTSSHVSLLSPAVTLRNGFTVHSGSILRINLN